MPHGHSAIDNLIALSSLKTYQAGGPVDDNTILGILSGGKYQTSQQIPPLSTTGKVTPENLSDVWSFLNPPPNPNLVGTGGLGVAEAIGPLVSPKNVGAVMKRLTGLMKRYPKSGIQKGMNELFGHLGKTKIFKEQMSRTPLAGKMLQHYFTGKGKQLSYAAPLNLKDAAEKIIRDGRSFPFKLTKGSYRLDLSGIQKGKTKNLLMPEGKAGRDINSALGTSTIKATKVSDDVLRVQHYDTYNFKPKYEPGKNWSFNAEVPEKIANRLPNFRMRPSSGEALRGYNASPGDAIIGAAKPLLDFSKIRGGSGYPVTINISGVDAVFPKLGLGKPFTSLSKPYYYNVAKQKFGDTAKSVR